MSNDQHSARKRPMRVLVDVTHPAGVHFFKVVIRRLRADGHQVLVTSREKDILLELLDREGIEHQCLSRKGHGLIGMGWELLLRDLRLLRAAWRFRPDVMLAWGGIFIGLPGALLRVPRLAFEDAEHAKIDRTISLPLSTYVCTGTGYLIDHGRKHLRYRGLPEYAYLDSRYFQPDAQVLRRAGVSLDEPYIILRTVSWEAGHDIGVKSPGEADVLDVIRRLSVFGRVLLTSEKKLPPALEPYRNPVPCEQMHHLLAFARLYIGEGGTMAAEAAILGAPAIYTSPLRTGYLQALEHDYQLIRNASTLAEGVEIAEQWLKDPCLSQVWGQRRRRLLEESEDVPAFMYRAIERIVTAGRGSA